GTVCVVGKMRDLILQLSKSSIYSTKPISMGKSLHMRIVAEGVETEEQLASLQALGCDLVQGYLIGKPSPLR
ncbi:EAL domain-containing protein, partial [Klebsiella pneumoniae]